MNANSLAAQIIIGILAEEMSLPATNLWLRDQNKLIPNDNGLYIVAGMVDSQIISNESYLYTPADTWDQPGDMWDQSDPEEHWDVAGDTWDIPGDAWPTPDAWDGTNTTQEVSEVQSRETIQIDLFSRSNDGILRNWEVVAAMQSIYGVQQQELNNCKIGRNPIRFINTSYAEGGSQLNRYTLTFSVFVWYRKFKKLEISSGTYYDDFTTRIDTEKTIGTDKPAIEFEINPSGVVPP